jgi:hypothetical protein
MYEQLANFMELELFMPIHGVYLQQEFFIFHQNPYKV